MLIPKLIQPSLDDIHFRSAADAIIIVRFGVTAFPAAFSAAGPLYHSHQEPQDIAAIQAAFHAVAEVTAALLL